MKENRKVDCRADVRYGSERVKCACNNPESAGDKVAGLWLRSSARCGTRSLHLPFLAGTASLPRAIPGMTGGPVFRQLVRASARAPCQSRSTIIKRRPASLECNWFYLAQRSINMMQGSDTVIAMRTAAMARAAACPSVALDREMKPMVDEKVDISAASLVRIASTPRRRASRLLPGVATGQAPTHRCTSFSTLPPGRWALAWRLAGTPCAAMSVRDQVVVTGRLTRACETRLPLKTGLQRA